MSAGVRFSALRSFHSFAAVAPFRCELRRAALSLRLAREKSLEIGGCAPQQARIVAKIADAEIAPATEQAAHLLGRVTVIDAQSLLRPLAADGAPATLPRQQRVVVFARKPVVGSEATIS